MSDISLEEDEFAELSGTSNPANVAFNQIAVDIDSQIDLDSNNLLNVNGGPEESVSMLAFQALNVAGVAKTSNPVHVEQKTPVKCNKRSSCGLGAVPGNLKKPKESIKPKSKSSNDQTSVVRKENNSPVFSKKRIKGGKKGKSTEIADPGSETSDIRKRTGSPGTVTSWPSRKNYNVDEFAKDPSYYPGCLWN